MKVFVTGATGYIGFHIALAMRRAGHAVWGLARDEKKARRLARHEVQPVMGDLAEPESWREAAEGCSVLVHAAFDGKGKGVAKDRTALDALIAAGESGARPKTLLYTSGVWVHGATGDRVVDETTPLDPLPIVTWRPPHEALVLGAAGVRGLVLRPGCVYGADGGLTAPWLAAADAGEPIEVVGDGRNRWTMVHAEDLADAYVRAAESGLGGEVFDVVDASRTPVGEMAAAAARAAGSGAGVATVPVEVAAERMGPFAAALAVDQQVDAGKAARLLGWRPRHQGFAAEAPTYLAAWRARRPRT